MAWVMSMDEATFAQRLTALRQKKNVSAREMSLALGQNESYINRIENRLSFPSMQNFFYICEYLNVSPAEFFDLKNNDPCARREILDALQTLDARQLEIVLSVVRGLSNTGK